MRTNPWLENSRENIIPLSKSSLFKEALNEWYFAGNVEDYGDTSVECELCEHPELRYHFEIKNKNNDNQLWVGSSCILRFQEIEVYDKNGKELLSDLERKTELQRTLKKCLEEKVLIPLRQLWKSYPPRSEERISIQVMVQQYKHQSGFSPHDLLWLFQKMDIKNIPCEPNRYKLSLRSDFSKMKLKSMSGVELNKILPSFSREQTQRFKSILSKIEHKI